MARQVIGARELQLRAMREASSKRASVVGPRELRAAVAAAEKRKPRPAASRVPNRRRKK
jgi:hypothetical protein